MAHILYKIPPDELSKVAFTYTALPENCSSIRLLKLWPDVGGNPVICSLNNHIWEPQTGFVHPHGNPIEDYSLAAFQHGRPDREPPVPAPEPRPHGEAYEALSYCWGDTGQLYRIMINDQTFPVTRNVLEALFYLRLRSSVRTLWIDAICINQADIIEKGSQIRHMHSIYHYASRVVVWLDISTQNSDLAFDFIEELYGCLPLEAKRGSEGELQMEHANPFGSQALTASASHLMTADKAREWLALHRLFKRPYWARAWIFQELLMARETLIVCGPKAAMWGPVDAAMRIVQHTGNRICDLINSSIPIKDQQTLYPTNHENPHYWTWNNNTWLLGLFEGRYYMKYRYGQTYYSQTMERWLGLIHNRLCKYQHDKIYSILGIMSEPVAKFIPNADYCQPAQNVFKHAVKAFVCGTGSLNILCYSHHTDTQDDLPSWTFDWRRQSRLHSVHDIAWGIGTDSQRAWHSSALSQYSAEFSDDLTLLSVHGILLGVVRYVDIESELLPGLEKYSRDEPDVDAYGNRTCHHDSHIMQRWRFNEDTNEALSLILSPHSNLVLEDAISTILYVLLLRRHQSRLKNCTPKSRSPDFAEDLKSGNIGVIMYLQSMTKCRTVIETDTLEFALAPFWTQPGDLICQFIGCTAPVILRKQEDDKYKFIGDCYVFGKMGRAMIDILKEVLKNPDGLKKYNLV